MTEATTARPIILRRVQMSTTAWTLLCESTSATLGLAAEPVTEPQPVDDDATAAGWSELQTLGMSPMPGEITRQWMGAIALLLAAPITVTARGTYNGVSTTTAVGLQAGRGLAVHQRHLSEQGLAGTTITGSEDSMEITLFSEENLWDAVSRLLPPLDVVRARAQNAPVDSEPAVVISTGTTPASIPAEDANITLSVTTVSTGLPPRVFSAVWSVQGETLFSVTTNNVTSASGANDAASEIKLTKVPAGHIAHELMFAVAGAHEILLADEKGSAAGTAEEAAAR
ncbi:hypothetical protein CVS30_05065 [Arthrobacter psychrolactophilus]|uniref:Uncharacterized protein n=1 Tax=Arthrobacter psychrolactophilus TaxID=92442 RepID=A0A2V5JMJ5_9MICC|nr:hypothetical protein [Arthrobacter psychrolactophilus]PYI39336.1 hypothetical protein CVS30_05065 [Arthrobacter psychrolactophilus]